MRLCVALAVISMFTSSAALAAKPKAKGKKAKVVKPAGPNMDSKDPAFTEKSDEGPYDAKPEEKKAATATVKIETEEAFTAPPRDPFVVGLQAVGGFGRSPKPGPANESETLDAQLIGIVASARYDVSPAFSAALAVPWSTASIDLPSRTGSEQGAAFGNPNLYGEYRVTLSPVTTLPIFFGVGVPVAQGDPDPNSTDEGARRSASVNLVADAATGWRDGELFWVNRLPVNVGVGVRYQSGALEVHAYDKVIVGVDLSTELAPRVYLGPGELKVNSVALRNVTLVGATYALIEKPWIWGGLDMWLVYNAIEQIEFDSPATDPTPLQLVAEPRLGARFGAVSPSVGFVFPIGGRLADSSISGVRAHVDIAL